MLSTTGRLERYVFGAPPGRVLVYRVVFLDPELERLLFESAAYARFVVGSRVRFAGEVEDIPVELAWQPAPGRGHYAMISPALCKQLAVDVGDEVTIRFEPIDPRRVTVPDDVRRSLATRTRDRARWKKLTPGQQRALLANVASARTDKTRAARIAKLFEPLDRLRRRDR